jgi:hypothetical protein
LPAALKKGVGSGVGTVSQRGADPDPHQNATDPPTLVCSECSAITYRAVAGRQPLYQLVTIVDFWRTSRQDGKISPGHRGPTPPPPSSTREEAGINDLKEEITLHFPTGIGERFSQTISNLGYAALLRRCELPL